jgi:transposase
MAKRARAEQGQKERRFFSAEFKLEAIRRADERRAAGVPLTQAARELGVTDDLLRAWRRQAAARTGAPAADVFPGQGRLPSDEEALRRLERENARLRQENAFLKSAAAYFARESR